MSNVKSTAGQGKQGRIRALGHVTGLAAFAATAALLASPSLAQAAPAQPAKAPVSAPPAAATVSHDNTLTPAVKKLLKGSGAAAERKALTTYWSEARMKAAKPYAGSATFKHLGTGPKQAPTAAEAKPQGAPVSIAPSKTATAPRAVTNGSTAVPQTSYPNYPYYHPVARTNGKVFFTRGGANYVCSGTIVNSEGKSLIWTAGHCLVDSKVWNSNTVFVPSYKNGSRPYGTWTARTLTTNSAWYYNRDFRQDNGAATVYRNFGYRIADYLGAQGLTWNQTPNFYTYAFGYPQGYPYNGQNLTLAAGSTYNAGNGTIYMWSGMTGGSSGGAWYRNFNGNWGSVNGHNDFIYTSSPNWMYSPYYGNQAANLYNTVRYQTS